ncbi:hypothetical protein P170DRAFT_453209 [Aspergillus steynii IBT 23096]|uniref:Steroid 5-alpha reductase C-terminal domain-containing protein n=1 Tax=Aspergillus steynii IBT 23096 TaxID=1392250 RepID=A0A2I2GF47_9EURO|nr:uncharacterized protein P170DRAFT_453209 [Aspergillus steynii IBT 23096]PLB51508.1 hypothetical protein P170DRAFT_453209 [Aspergillus steynii IBT 23096]
MAPGNGPQLRDNVSRVKQSSPAGKSIFVGLRAADVFWQYNLLYRGWGIRLIEKLGGHSVHSSLVLNPLTVTGLQPYYGLVTLLSLGSSVKQIVHIILVSEQAMDVGSGCTIGFFNTIFNTINTLLSLWAVASPAASSLESTSLLDTFSSPLIAVGSTAYAIGLLAEATSEFQRKAFKQDPKNKGKPYGGGLFSLAININYGAYTTWRGAYALICGGILWGATTFGFFFRDFATRGVPVLDEYMSQRYGDAYREIKARVRYSLIPGIY